MELQHAIITDVNVDTFKKYLGVSMSVKKSDILNFNMSSVKMSGISNNEGDSIYKKWEVDFAEFAGNVSEEFPELKCSIYKGDELRKKILPYFGQLVNMKVFYLGEDVKKLELFKTDEAGRISLKITILCASNETAYIEYSAELLNQIFNPEEANLTYTFNLSEAELSAVSKLSKLSTNPEQQTDYITLFTEEGLLKATDKAFDTILHDGADELKENIDLDKKLWTLIDKDDYVAKVYDVDNNKVLVCTSTTRKVMTTLVLLSKVDETVDFADFENNDDDWN